MRLASWCAQAGVPAGAGCGSRSAPRLAAARPSPLPAHLLGQAPPSPNTQHRQHHPREAATDSVTRSPAGRGGVLSVVQRAAVDGRRRLLVVLRGAAGRHAGWWRHALARLKAAARGRPAQRAHGSAASAPPPARPAPQPEPPAMARPGLLRPRRPPAPARWWCARCGWRRPAPRGRCAAPGTWRRSARDGGGGVCWGVLALCQTWGTWRTGERSGAEQGVGLRRGASGGGGGTRRCCAGGGRHAWRGVDAGRRAGRGSPPPGADPARGPPPAQPRRTWPGLAEAIRRWPGSHS